MKLSALWKMEIACFISPKKPSACCMILKKILRKRVLQLVLRPPSMACMAHNCCGYVLIGLYVFQTLAGLWGGIPFWLILICATINSPIILFLTVGLSWKDFMEFSKEINRVGRASGIARPEKIDMLDRTKKSRKSGRPDLLMSAYYL